MGPRTAFGLGIKIERERLLMLRRRQTTDRSADCGAGVGGRDGRRPGPGRRSARQQRSYRNYPSVDCSCHDILISGRRLKIRQTAAN